MEDVHPELLSLLLPASTGAGKKDATVSHLQVA